MSVAAKPLTWDDIKDWPEDSSQRTELVHGELVMSPAPGTPHQRCVSRLMIALGVYLEEKSLGEVISGPVDVVLAPSLVYEPDLCYISHSRLGIIRETHIAGAPDLCIEIISESNRTHDTVVKYRDYAEYGVSEYWLVDLREGEIVSLRNDGGQFSVIGRAGPGDRVRSAVLPGLDLDPKAALQL